MPRAKKATESGSAAARLTPEQLQEKINKQWPGVMRMGSDPTLKIERIPTGLLAIDCTLRGGFARGRHIELYGGYNVGKTAIGFSLMATTQDNGGRASMIDAEGTFDPDFAEQLGVDLSTLALSRQSDLENGHRAVDYIEAQLRSELYDVIMLDSIAALLPKVEQEESMEAPSMGTQQALLMSKALRKLTVANKRTVLLFINQTRQAVGASAFAKQTITSGGRAMGFYAGTRLEVNRLENISHKGPVLNSSTGEFTDRTVTTGHRLQVRVEKDKTGSAYQTEETSMVYDYDLGGFDYYEDLLYLGRKHRIIKKNGASWWLPDYPEDKKNGRANFKTWLQSDDAIAEELQEAIEAAAYATDEEEE